MSRDFPTNASSDRIDVGTWDLASGGSFTLCASVYFDSLSNNTDHRFIAKATGTATNAHRWMLGRLDSDGNNRLRARARFPGGVQTYLSTNDVFNANQWHHAALRYNGANIDLFLDGTEVSAAAYAETADLQIADSSTVLIGNAPGTGGLAHSIDGRLAQILITTRALSNDELNAIANGVPVTRFVDASCELCMPLGHGSPETDFSGNDRSGTITGSVTIGDHSPVGPLFGFDEPYSAFAAPVGGVSNPKGPLGMPLHGPLGGPI